MKKGLCAKTNVLVFIVCSINQTNEWIMYIQIQHDV